MKKRLSAAEISRIDKLVKAGASLKNVSENLGLRKSTIYYHAKKHCRKMSKLELNLLSESEKGYLVGLFLGDGSFNRGSKSPRFFVRFALDLKRDQNVAAHLSKILAKAGKKVNLITWRSNTIAKTCSKELVNYLQKHVEYAQGNKRLLDSQNCSDNFRYGFIAGIIDSDGHVHSHLGTEIKTVSSRNFESISSILKDLGISANRKVRESSDGSFSKKPCYVIYIPSSEMKRLKNRIPSAKVARYLDMINSFGKG